MNSIITTTSNCCRASRPKDVIYVLSLPPMPRSPDKRWPSPSEREDRNRDRRGIGGPSSSSAPLPPSSSSGGRYDSGRYGYNKRDDRRDDRRDERGVGRYDRYEDDRRRGWSGRSGAGEGVRGDYHQDGYTKPVYSREGEIVTMNENISPVYGSAL